MDTLSTYFDQLINLALLYAPKLILAILAYIVGSWIVKRIVNLFTAMLDKKDVDASISIFLKSLIAIILKTLLILSVISMIGIETSSFVAILAAVGFAIGMALQGSLGNFAGGVLILIFKPFKVDDVIDAQGFLGVVHSIQVFNTVLKTPDNKTIIIPNGALSNSPIANLTREDTRRVDMVFGIGYSDDIAKAKAVIQEVLDNCNLVLKDPAPNIFVSELADSSVNFVVRPWSKTEDYWAVYFHCHEQIKLKFDENNISIPFPQSDIHLFKQN